MAIDDFKGTRPIFLLEQFFVGRIEGWAVVESLVGGLLKRATIAAHGEFESDTQIVLFTETYTFDDGHSDTLHWTIRKGDEGRYTGLENRRRRCNRRASRLRLSLEVHPRHPANRWQIFQAEFRQLVLCNRRSHLHRAWECWTCGHSVCDGAHNISEA